ncbi:MAG: hypothetical protein WKG32_08255 [Gemmatimonadaceae bacterium]
MGSSKRLAIVFLVGALLVGASVTYAAERFMGKTDCARTQDRPGMRERLATDLELSAEQRVLLDSILDRRHHDMTAVMSTVRPQLDSIRTRARGEIARMLNDDQRVVFQRQIEEGKRDSVARSTEGGKR